MTDTSGFDAALKRPMPTHSHPANAEQFQATTIDFEAIAEFFEAKGTKAVTALEPGVARRLACFHSPEECLESLVQVCHYYLEYVAVDTGSVGIGFSVFFDPAKLLDFSDSLALKLIGYLALFQAQVVEPAACLDHRLKTSSLRLRWIEPVLEGLEHQKLLILLLAIITQM